MVIISLVVDQILQGVFSVLVFTVIRKRIQGGSMPDEFCYIYIINNFTYDLFFMKPLAQILRLTKD